MAMLCLGIRIFGGGYWGSPSFGNPPYKVPHSLTPCKDLASTVTPGTATGSSVAPERKFFHEGEARGGA